MKTVTILQHRLLHYRMDLFTLLRARLAAHGVTLQVVHGQPSEAYSTRKDTGRLGWTTEVRNLYWNVGGVELVWQPAMRFVGTSDLVVLMQENRVLSNYPILVRRHLPRCRAKLGYWGHGVNFQSEKPRGLRERWKALLVTRIDWWFAYTEATRRLLLDAGYSERKITCLNNAIDTASLRREYEAVGDDEVADASRELGLPQGSKVGIFCGSFYGGKRIQFMLDAADRVRALVPDFEFIILGDGPLAGLVRERAAQRPWIHYLGAITGSDRLVYFRMARLMINPGLLGLHILDSFAMGIPIVSTKSAPHSPEIVYLENGLNGVLVDGGRERYSEVVAGLLTDEASRSRLAEQARKDAERYTVERMAENFERGILECLAS